MGLKSHQHDRGASGGCVTTTYRVPGQKALRAAWTARCAFQTSAAGRRARQAVITSGFACAPCGLTGTVAQSRPYKIHRRAGTLRFSVARHSLPLVILGCASTSNFAWSRCASTVRVFDPQPGAVRLGSNSVSASALTAPGRLPRPAITGAMTGASS